MKVLMRFHLFCGNITISDHAYQASPLRGPVSITDDNLNTLHEINIFVQNENKY